MLLQKHSQQMTLTNNRIKEITKGVVKISFFNYFLCRKDVSTRHILLYRFFPVESSIRSAIGGLETSLGITLWERIATKLALENGFDVLNPKTDFLQPTILPTSIRNLLALHKELRETANANIPISQYVEELLRVISQLDATELPTAFTRLSKGSGADIYLRKEGNEYAFDLKTVQINAGGGTKFNDTLMKWLTFRALHQSNQNTTNTFNAHIVIPYDPHVDSDWWTQFGDRAYPLDRVDLKLGDEFWDFISGCRNSIDSITDAFDELVTEDFHNIYRNCLHQAGVPVSINILERLSNVTCTTPQLERPEAFGVKLSWQCVACAKEFRASIKWFLKMRHCQACNVSFF